MWRKYNRREGGRGRVDERVTVSVRKRERDRGCICTVY